jgi:hypothetical protein
VRTPSQHFRREFSALPKFAQYEPALRFRDRVRTFVAKASRNGQREPVPAKIAPSRRWPCHCSHNLSSESLASDSGHAVFLMLLISLSAGEACVEGRLSP